MLNIYQDEGQENQDNQRSSKGIGTEHQHNQSSGCTSKRSVSHLTGESQGFPRANGQKRCHGGVIFYHWRCQFSIFTFGQLQVVVSTMSFCFRLFHSVRG